MLHPGDLLYINALDQSGRNYDKVIEDWRKITRDIKADIIILQKMNYFLTFENSSKLEIFGSMEHRNEIVLAQKLKTQETLI